MDSLLLHFFPPATFPTPPAALFPPRSASIVSPPSPLLFPSFRSSIRRNLTASCSASSSSVVSQDISEIEQVAGSKEDRDALSPSSFEVQSLLMEICDETSIAELELKMASFKLRVKRDASKLKSSATVVPVAPPVPSKPMEESGVPVVVPTPSLKSSASSSVVTAANANAKVGSKFGLLEAASDEGLQFVTSPKVGFFRRSRVVKGKSGRPLCQETQTVKEGQVVCYVDQLGTQEPIEAKTSGEVIKILCKDGDAVGYGDPLIAIRPSFAGIR